jgi:septum formation protein
MPASRQGGLWLGEHPLLLASASTARRALLVSAGLLVDTEVSGVDERALQEEGPCGGPGALATRLAAAKALAVSRRRPDRVVIGADQVLDCEGDILTKPPDASAARHQIRRLAGRTHVLHSAFAIARDGEIDGGGIGTARLTMRPLELDAIRYYVAQAGPAATRSVGGYEVEGLGIHLFHAIEGEQGTILGLPLLPLLAELRRLGLLAL